MFDHAHSVDIHLCSAVRTVLKDRISNRLGVYLFSLRSLNLGHSCEKTNFRSLHSVSKL